MKRFIATATMMAVMILSLASFAVAAEEKIIGTVEKIEMQGKSAIVTLKDSKSGKETKILVEDDLTLDKFKDKRISEGDEIRCKFDTSDKNKSKLFRKTAGC
ncbi:MAG: hypothetical protein HYS23_03905 [Geobacter sp.]|nr:hypothetical protein [Geobacter sp.]